MNKKGMEVWQLVMMILALILLIFLVAWYAGLNEGMSSLFKKLGDLL